MPIALWAEPWPNGPQQFGSGPGAVPRRACCVPCHGCASPASGGWRHRRHGFPAEGATSLPAAPVRAAGLDMQLLGGAACGRCCCFAPAAETPALGEDVLLSLQASIQHQAVDELRIVDLPGSSLRFELQKRSQLF